jgi:hypothetical protein
MAPNANLETNRATASREELIAELEAACALRNRALSAYSALVRDMYAVANDFAARAADTAIPSGALTDSHLERMRTWAQASEMLRTRLEEL